jgi:hypothetical protein
LLSTALTSKDAILRQPGSDNEQKESQGERFASWTGLAVRSVEDWFAYVTSPDYRERHNISSSRIYRSEESDCDHWHWWGDWFFSEH